MSTSKEKVSAMFWVAILVSSIGAFVFGFALGFTSPTMVANYQSPGPDKDKISCIQFDGMPNKAN
eukprot:SAG31_NODE_23432_length_504_cov_1.145679_1_plen_64_part_10